MGAPLPLTKSVRIPGLALATYLILAHALICLTESVSLRCLGVFAVLLAPGLIAGIKLFSSHDKLSRLFLGSSIAFSGLILGAYALAFIPGVLGSPIYLITADIASTIALWPGRQQPKVIARKLPVTRIQLALLSAIILLGAVFRLANLGHAEFQGDETRALILANAAVADPTVLFTHKKGPGEVILPLSILSVTGRINEFGARLPFAIAGALLPLGVFCLAVRLWRRGGAFIGLWAAGFVATDGFLLAFSRIVQYQSVLVLLSLGALVAASEATALDRLSNLARETAVVLAASALLCHYDALSLLPALVFLMLSLPSLSGVSRGAVLRVLGLPAFQYLTVAASFYIPMATSEQFTSTAGYLASRAGIHKLPVNNVPHYLDLLTFYGTTYQTYIEGLLLFIAGLAAFSQLRQPLIRASCMLAWTACVSFVSAFPNILVFGESRSAAIFLAAPLLAGICCLPGLEVPVRALLLWAVPGLTLLGFLFARPNTHFYVFHAAWALLAGYALFCSGSLARGRLRKSLSCLATICIGVSLPYLYIVYVRPQPEYRNSFPKARPWLYQAPYGNKLPTGAFFGFPHISGWKAVGELYRTGQLSGSYDSNEEPLITAWYTRGAARAKNGDCFFLVSNPNDPAPYSPSVINRDYHFFGRVYADGERRLDIFTKADPGRPPQRFDVESFYDSFDEATLSFSNIDEQFTSIALSR